ncbi:MAG: cystathionine beta-lyase [Pseudomonadota bacterium]|nr:cystathionine beta-lyase [Pseudomonadota bacterium]
MPRKIADPARLKPETQLVVAAREYAEHGMVNPAVYRASTILFPDVQTLTDRSQEYLYGRRGTPTSRALEAAITLLEGGHATKVCASGLAAVTTALLAFLKAGDHLLMTDAVYAPSRHFCDGVLRKLDIETTYYDPRIGKKIGELLKSNTRLVYLESPGSNTMEVQDVPAIAEAVHRHDVLVAMDNTWSGGHYFKPLAKGCDISIQSATKYLTGHSDAMLGAVTCSQRTWPQFKDTFEQLGQFAGPDDMYLALRGLRTLDVRLERHMKNALEIARWLKDRPEVARVLHPALPDDPGHALWKRDYTGASGLFSVILKTSSRPAVAAMLDGLSLFGMGYSWGGYESLVVPFDPAVMRSATKWQESGIALRFHVGLENTTDLKNDIAAGFERLNAAGA